MSKKYRIGYLDEDEGYQAKFYQAFKNEFDIKILPIENINNVYDVLRFINDEELDALVVDYRLADSGQLTFNGDSVVDLINSQKKYFPLVMLTSYAQDAIAHMEDVYIVKDKEEIESSANLFLKQLETAIDRYQTKIITAENKIKELSEKKVLSIFSLLTNLTSVPVPRIPAGRCRSQVPRGQDPAVPGKMLFLPHPAHLRSWSRGRSD